MISFLKNTNHTPSWAMQEKKGIEKINAFGLRKSTIQERNGKTFDEKDQFLNIIDVHTQH